MEGIISFKGQNEIEFLKQFHNKEYDSPLLVPLAKKSYTRVLELKLRQYEFM